MHDPTETIAATREEVARRAAAFQEASAGLGPVSGKDSAGAVSVTIDGAGRVTSIAVGMTWRDHYTGHTLANGVNEAVGAATAERLNAWGGAVVDESERPASAATPAALPLDDLVDGLEQAAGRDRTGSAEGAMRAMRDTLRELVDSIDQVKAEVQAHLTREYEGRSGSGHARARVLGNGTLTDLTFDATWLDSAHPHNIGREATQAVHEAYRRLGDQDVSTILARSPLGRVQRLSEDPVALARSFGLRD